MRKLFFNVGFQFNYGEPFAVSNFYNPPYYANIFNGRDLKNGNSTNNSTEENLQFDDGTTKDSTFDTTTDGFIGNSHGQSRSIDGSNDLVGKDVSAAQFYESIEDNFVEYVLIFDFFRFK